MADTGTKRAETQPNEFGTTYQFHQVFDEEIEVIARKVGPSLSGSAGDDPTSRP
jgi:hypothetical protein